MPLPEQVRQVASRAPDVDDAPCKHYAVAMTRSTLSGRQPATKFSKWLAEHGHSSAKLAEALTQRASGLRDFRDVTCSKKAVDSWRAGYRYPGTVMHSLLRRVLKITEDQLDELLEDDDE